MLSKQQLVTLLGRPLTSTEDANYKTYIDIATKRLSNLLCFSLDDTTGPRTFDSRSGYRTVYIDPCTAVSAVTLDGQVMRAYVKKQNDSYQGDWFNILEFDDQLDGSRVVVTASWGFEDCLPHDLGLLLAGLFGIHETEVSRVKSKEIEDFRVTYKDGSQLDAVVAAHLSTVAKYAQCERAVMHGLSQPVYSY